MNFRWNYEPPTTENEACAEGLAEEVSSDPCHCTDACGARHTHG